MIHLLVGPDRYLLERELKHILSTLDQDGLSTTRYEKSTSIGEVSNAVATAGFFGAGRVIVAEGIMKRVSDAGKRNKPDEESGRPAGGGDVGLLDEVHALFESIAPGNTLILVDPDVDTIPAPVRKAAGPDAVPFGGRAPRDAYLLEWVQAELRALGARIENRNIARLLDRLYPGDWRKANNNPKFDNPPDLQRLVNELAKLATAADGNEINARDIDELVPSASGDELFPLVDAIVAGNASAAFRKLAGDEGDDEASARILNQLVSRTERGRVLAEASPGEAPEVGKKVGVNSAGQLVSIQRTFGRNEATAVADVVLESDRRLKTGVTRSPSEQLHEIIVRRAMKRRGR